MSDEILDQRRLFKNINQEKYTQLHHKIRSKIKQAKQEWLSNQCSEIEDLEAKHDSFNMHKKVKEAAGLYKRRSTGTLIDQQGKIIPDTHKN